MSRKFLVTIVLILFLLPFVSWYYLRSGLNWRKQAQEIMNGTVPFPAGTWRTADDRPFDTKSLEGHVSLVGFLPCTTEAEVSGLTAQLYEQFRETQKASFVFIDTCALSTSDIQTADRRKWFILPCRDTLRWCDELVRYWPPDKSMALVDRNGVIRSYYPIATPEEKKLLVEHMALLLPRERQEKVELKRGDKK